MKKFFAWIVTSQVFEECLAWLAAASFFAICIRAVIYIASQK